MLADAAAAGASSWALRRSVFLSRLSVFGSADAMTKLLRPSRLLVVGGTLAGCPALPGAGLAWTSAMGMGCWTGSTPANGIAKAKPAGMSIGMLDWPKRLLGSNPPALVPRLSRVVALSWPCVRPEGLVLGAVALPNRACMAVSARPWVRAKAARLARSGRGSPVVMTLSFVPREMTCSPASSMT